MNNSHNLFSSAALFLSLGALSVSADPSSDPSPQEQAMEHLVVSLAQVQGESKMSAAIPTLMQGLSDSDVNVRRQAASGILMIAAVTSRVTNPALPNGPDLTADPANQKALLKTMSDPDDQVRMTAMKAYSATYALTPDVEDKIMAEFKVPDTQENNPGDKVAMIECLLLQQSPSVKAQSFLADALDNPKYAPFVAERIAADNRPLSPAILDKLAAKLADAKSPQNRATFARAIGIYGKQAQRYIPLLQTTLANEKNEMIKANIRAAIDKANQ